jgi:hypothetical protein
MPDFLQPRYPRVGLGAYEAGPDMGYQTVSNSDYPTPGVFEIHLKPYLLEGLQAMHFQLSRVAKEPTEAVRSGNKSSQPSSDLS